MSSILTLNPKFGRTIEEIEPELPAIELTLQLIQKQTASQVSNIFMLVDTPRTMGRKYYRNRSDQDKKLGANGCRTLAQYFEAYTNPYLPTLTEHEISLDQISIITEARINKELQNKVQNGIQVPTCSIRKSQFACTSVLWQGVEIATTQTSSLTVVAHLHPKRLPEDILIEGLYLAHERNPELSITLFTTDNPNEGFVIN